MFSLLKLSTYQHMRAFWTDRLVVQFALSNGKDFPRALSYGIAVLGDEKRAREDQTPDREMMPVPALPGRGTSSCNSISW
jgi:hypothetical protein